MLARHPATPIHQPLHAAMFAHVIVIVQENRTPDNLFQGLCAPPYGSSAGCSTTPNTSQYNIQTANWLDKHSPGGMLQPMPVPLANRYDLNHGHSGFVAMCDATAGSTTCHMDGAGDVTCVSNIGACINHPQFRYVDNSAGQLKPYLDLATQYGWANYMFQTNQGPSFPAHQFLFGGTSAASAADDAAGIFAAENMGGTGNVGGQQKVAGCIASAQTIVRVISPQGEFGRSYPCFEHQTVPDLLHSGISWRYYAPNAGSIWTAPNAIKHICQSTGPGGECTGPAWKANVDLNSADVLRDIAACQLRSVSWVIPTGANSDHARGNDGGGPSWVAAIVNAIGTNTTCDGKVGYWKNTAILITWDDWGGWYDHQAPTILSGVQGDYQYGFRVPLLAVSAYTPKGYIDNTADDFGSILRFIEHNFGVDEGALHFADQRAASDLAGFFRLDAAPRPYRTIDAPKNGNFFLTDRRRATDPDDQ